MNWNSLKYREEFLYIFIWCFVTCPSCCTFCVCAFALFVFSIEFFPFFSIQDFFRSGFMNMSLNEGYFFLFFFFYNNSGIVLYCLKTECIGGFLFCRNVSRIEPVLSVNFVSNLFPVSVPSLGDNFPVIKI